MAKPHDKEQAFSKCYPSQPTKFVSVMPNGDIMIITTTTDDNSNSGTISQGPDGIIQYSSNANGNNVQSMKAIPKAPFGYGWHKVEHADNEQDVNTAKLVLEPKKEQNENLEIGDDVTTLELDLGKIPPVVVKEYMFSPIDDIIKQNKNIETLQIDDTDLMITMPLSFKEAIENSHISKIKIAESADISWILQTMDKWGPKLAVECNYDGDVQNSHFHNLTVNGYAPHPQVNEMGNINDDDDIYWAE